MFVDPVIKPIDTVAKLPENLPHSSLCAKALTISLIAAVVFAIFAALAFTIAALAAHMPLLLIGTFAATTAAAGLCNFFFCKCLNVQPFGEIRRQFARLPPASPLHARQTIGYDSKVIEI